MSYGEEVSLPGMENDHKTEDSIRPVSWLTDLGGRRGGGNPRKVTICLRVEITSHHRSHQNHQVPMRRCDMLLAGLWWGAETKPRISWG